jgi:hypothetical protein
LGDRGLPSKRHALVKGQAILTDRHGEGHQFLEGLVGLAKAHGDGAGRQFDAFRRPTEREPEPPPPAEAMASNMRLPSGGRDPGVEAIRIVGHSHDERQHLLLGIWRTRAANRGLRVAMEQKTVLSRAAFASLLGIGKISQRPEFPSAWPPEAETGAVVTPCLAAGSGSLTRA